MNIISLSEADVGIARRWSDEVEAVLPRAPNHTGIVRPDRYMLGYLGEIAFARWLDGTRRVYQHRVELTGRTSRVPEFRAWEQGADITIDVKTWLRRGQRNGSMLVSVRQELDADLYVCACIDDIESGLVELPGWAERAEVAAAPAHDYGYGPSRSIPLTNLRPMSALLRRLDARLHVDRQEAA